MASAAAPPPPSHGPRRAVLAVNGGSSSLKLAVYAAAADEARLWSGRIERIGLPGAKLHFGDAERRAEVPDHDAAARLALEALRREAGTFEVVAIGHRVVHGGERFAAPTSVTPEVLAELRRLEPFAPRHLPSELAVLEAFTRHFPGLPQVACFDTAFHRELPREARLLPIPRRYEALGVRRYGFHGISYAYLMEELTRLDPAAAGGRVVLAHLGNGASLAAVRGGRALDTSMAFTPTAGIPMSTRSGDLDPGVLWYLGAREGLGIEKLYRMLNEESGLLGLSETSSDVRDLLAREAAGDARAADALAVFCYALRLRIGAYAAALGGLETLVFSAGIGEHAPEVRARACAGLEFLGVTLDPAANARHAPVVSAPGGKVTVRVIPTDEERMIARDVRRLLNLI